MKTHPNYTMYGGNCVFLKQGRLKGRFLPKIVLNLSFSWNNFSYVSQTSGLLYRNVIFSNGVTNEFLQAENTFDRFVYRGENLRILRHLQKGKLFLSGDDVAVYRIHKNGIFRGSRKIWRTIAWAHFMLRLYMIFPDYKKYHEATFFLYYSRMLRVIYKNRGNPNFLKQKDCDLLKEIYRLFPTANLDWSKLKWHSIILIKCFYKARTCAWLLCRQMYRILSRKQIV